MNKIKNPNQVQIVDKEKGITLQILYGEVSLFQVQETPGKDSNKDFFTDNEEFIRAMFRIFKKAEELGYLGVGQRATNEDGEPFTVIEI